MTEFKVSRTLDRDQKITALNRLISLILDCPIVQPDVVHSSSAADAMIQPPKLSPHSAGKTEHT